MRAGILWPTFPKVPTLRHSRPANCCLCVGRPVVGLGSSGPSGILRPVWDPPARSSLLVPTGPEDPQVGHRIPSVRERIPYTRPRTHKIVAGSTVLDGETCVATSGSGSERCEVPRCRSCAERETLTERRWLSQANGTGENNDKAREREGRRKEGGARERQSCDRKWSQRESRFAKRARAVPRSAGEQEC